MLPTQKRIKEVLDYDPEKGTFTQKIIRRGPKSKTGLGYKHQGYLKISIDGVKYGAHRLAFIFMTGECPRLVDHIDRNGLNNRWDNLRAATFSENCVNTKQRRRKDETLARNIYRRNGGVFSVVLKRDRKYHRVGSFQSLKEAIAARDSYIQSLTTRT